MVIDSAQVASLVSTLESDDWVSVLQGVDDAEKWLRTAIPGSNLSSEVISAAIRLATHPKWEIRRAIANLAARSIHPAFEPVLARFVTDDNALVRMAAQRAALRRRDWQNASAFGKQHEERINATLDDIEARFGVRGREAVKRASEQINDTFARELYHEMIKLVAPITNSAERLGARLADATLAREQLADDALTIRRRVSHLKAVLDAMRAFTAQPTLTFTTEDVSELIAEALAVVREGSPDGLIPDSVVGRRHVPAQVCRPRLVQALTNLIINAVEAYENMVDRRPIRLAILEAEGGIEVIIEDFGCGMSDEVLADAVVLFATHKPQGTGFGLPLAMKIVESEHRGRLTLESERGRGTTVRIALPIHRSDPQ